MASTRPHLITVEEFLAIKWDDSDVKAELDNGVIRIMRVMAGGNVDHSRVQGNVFNALFNRLIGRGCRPHGSDIGIAVSDVSLRYPDVSVFCGRNGPDDGKRRVLDDPRVVVEVLSPSTRESDIAAKLPEYRGVASLSHIVYIDSELETVRLLTRTGTRSWNDEDIDNADVVLSELQITLTWSEIFGRE